MKHYSLVGIDGNAYSIMGYVLEAMKECKMSKEDQNKYLEDAKSSDYNHLVYVSSEMIDYINEMEMTNEIPDDEL